MERNTHMTVSFQAIVRLAVLIIVFVIAGCSDSPDDMTIEGQKDKRPGFTANVSGAVNAEVSGAGIVTYLGPKERDVATGNRPGYFLIANINTDLAGEKGFTITFRIPDEAQPGSHPLMTADPRRLGENFDVRVERVEEGKLISYQTNTDGTLTLDNFSPDRNFPNISNITGTFQFVTENSDGERIAANGSFEFPTKRKLVSLGLSVRS